MDYISNVEKAKMIRQVLKESFPGTKFSVTSSSYSGGSSIRLSWTDGPSVKNVDSMVGVFEGSYFDGQIDYKGSRYHTLDGKPVRFSGDFVMTSRDISPEYATRAFNKIMEMNWSGLPEVKLEDYLAGKYIPLPDNTEGSWDFQNLVYRHALVGMGDEVAPLPSKTAARVRCVGDEEYRAGSYECHPHPAVEQIKMLEGVENGTVN